MQSPLQLTFRHSMYSEAIDAHVRQLAEKLERYTTRIISCHVKIDSAPKHSHHKKPVHVVVLVGLPGTTIEASRSHDDDPASLHTYAAIDAAFAEVERRIVEHSRRHRSARAHAAHANSSS